MINSFFSAEELNELGLKYIGKNVKISRFARIYGADRIEIGDDSRIDDFCILSGKVKIGSHVHIAAFCGLFAGDEGIVFEDYSGLSSKGSVYALSDDYTGHGMTNPTVPDKWRRVYGGKVTFEKYSILGTGCTVLPDVTIGEGAAVGAMSLINRNIEPWTIWAGIPIHKISRRSKEMLKYIIQSTVSGEDIMYGDHINRKNRNF